MSAPPDRPGMLTEEMLWVRDAGEILLPGGRWLSVWVSLYRGQYYVEGQLFLPAAHEQGAPKKGGQRFAIPLDLAPDLAVILLAAAYPPEEDGP